MFDDMRLDPIQALVRAPLLEGTRVKRAARSKEPNYLWRYNTIFYKIDHGFGMLHFNIALVFSIIYQTNKTWWIFDIAF